MSSPRQKMVVVAPPQPSELEQRKKRQTLERARANHLSKQLQMRLQYAKLKVEHGWQRQNLNEVENLYFHHSHLRSMRQSGATQPPQHTTVTYTLGSSVPVPAETQVGQSSAPSGVPDRTAGLSPSANDLSPSDSVSPPLLPSEPTHSTDECQPHLAAAQTPVPVLPAPATVTNRPPSVMDLTDPNILTRLVQLQAQVQLPSQSQLQAPTQIVSRHPSATILSSTSASQPGPVPVPVLTPSTFAPHPTNRDSQPSLVFGTPTPGSVTLYPLAPSQQPNPTSASATTPIPTIPTTTPIAPSALTYDSFWSTHASSTGSSRALYRTHTGFTASVTPGGNVAMLTPGGHTAVMTADGVYVGGVSK